MKTLAVYQTLPAPPVTAAWLRARLHPVIAACKFEQPIPLELRATGKFRGWCGEKNYYRDGRVCVTNQAIFWRPDQILEVYLHECAHRLLAGREVADHGPEFFALTAALYIRSSHFFERNPVQFLQLYDFGDVLENYRGEVLDWALAVAEKLAATDKTAEELANEVCQLWAKYVVNKEVNELKKIAQIRAQINLKEEFRAINKKLFLWRTVSASGWSVVLSICYFLIIR